VVCVYVRLSLVPLLVGTVVRPLCVSLPHLPLYPIIPPFEWLNPCHEVNDSLGYDSCGMCALWQSSQFSIAYCVQVHPCPQHTVTCSVILILITFSIAYCVQGLKDKEHHPLRVSLHGSDILVHQPRAWSFLHTVRFFAHPALENVPVFVKHTPGRSAQQGPQAGVVATNTS
jgi:hypothetical protein